MADLWWGRRTNLDDAQKDAIKLPLNENHLVTGPPGSGKTNLLLLRALNLQLLQKSDYQILVFTKALKSFVGSGAGRYSVPPSRVLTSMKFLDGVRYSLGIAPPPSGLSFEEHRKALAASVRSHVIAHKTGFQCDHLLIDEAQDYTKEEIEAFFTLAKRVYAVGDDRQRLYTKDADSGMALLRAKAKTTPLPWHYRNGLAICRLADRLAEKWGPAMSNLTKTSRYDEVAHPSDVRVYPCSSFREEVRLALQNLDAQAEVYPKEDLALLVPKNTSLAALGEALDEQDRPYRNLGEDWDAQLALGPQLWIGTVHNAKGCEFRAVHVLNSEGFRGMPNTRQMAYTAATRARTILCWYHSADMPAFLASSLNDEPEKARDMTVEQMLNDLEDV